MGRKLHRKVVTRPRPSLPTIFECPRCEAEAVKIEIKENPVSIATVMCGNCHITKTFTDLKRLYDKVDIFGIWVDNYYEELEQGITSEEYETESPTSDTDDPEKKESTENPEDDGVEKTKTTTEESSETSTGDEKDNATDDDDLDDEEDEYKQKYNLKLRK